MTSKPNINIINEQLSKFRRLLQLKYHFYVNSEYANTADFEENKDNRFGKIPSLFEPKKTSIYVDNFIDHLTNNIYNNLSKKAKRNLTKHEFQAINSIRSKNIVIRPADKGAGICVMSTGMYETKCYALLGNTKEYRLVDSINVDNIMENSNKILNKFKNNGIISQKEFDFATAYTPRIPVFYGNPKVHKQNIPLRPIISQIDGPTSRLNKLADNLLTTTEARVDNLIKDTPSFLNMVLGMDIPKGALLVTMDVTSLYTNIPWEEGVDLVVREFTLAELTMDPKLLRELLEFILHNNFFAYNQKYYQQTFGTAWVQEWR